MTAVTAERVRQMLETVWMQQACAREADRPRVLAALLKDSPGSAGSKGYGRASLEPRVAAATEALTAAVAAGLPEATALDNVIWRVFPLLTHDSRSQLTELLLSDAVP